MFMPAKEANKWLIGAIRGLPGNQIGKLCAALAGVLLLISLQPNECINKHTEGTAVYREDGGGWRAKQLRSQETRLEEPEQHTTDVRVDKCGEWEEVNKLASQRGFITLNLLYYL